MKYCNFYTVLDIQAPTIITQVVILITCIDHLHLPPTSNKKIYKLVS